MWSSCYCVYNVQFIKLVHIVVDQNSKAAQAQTIMLSQNAPLLEDVN